MHEASVTEALVKLALEAAAKEGAKKVTALNLVVGEATGYMRESLEFYFGIFAKGSILEGAALNMSYVKPKLKCPACGLVFERQRFSFECPACGAQGLMTGFGNEFYIDTMDIEREEG